MDVKSSTYDTVPLTDDHDHDGSETSTKVDESLMCSEKPWHSQLPRSMNHMKRHTRLSGMRSHRWLIDTFLLVVILLLLVVLLLREDSKNGLPGQQLQIGGDYHGTGPTSE